MNIQTSKKPQVAIMNAVHDLPVLVARDNGFFRDEGLDIDFVTTPGMAQVTTTHLVKFDSIFERPLESVYNDGGIDQFRMCEWGIMKRAVEADREGLRGRKIVALGASMSKFAIVVARDSDAYEPEMLKDKAIAVTPNNGSHFTTLKMMEGFLAPEHIKTTHAGSMQKRLEAVREGKVAAASLMEPWISVAQKQGLRILIEFAFDPQRSGRRRPRRPDARKDVSCPGKGGQSPRKRPDALYPLPDRGDRRPAGAPGVADVAPPSRPAAAVHP